MRKLLLLIGATLFIPAARAADPAWLAGKPLNEWFAIAGTGGAGGAPVNAYSGMTVKGSTSEVIIAAAGGHGDSSDNRVVSIDLRADAPAWILRHAASPVPSINQAYNADGQPSSRHTYHSTQFVEAVDRVMLFGLRFGYPGAYEFPTVDGFNLNTNTWDPAGTWPDVPAGGGYGVVKETTTGNVWTYGLKKWTAATNTWSSPITTTPPLGVRFPYAFDSKRNQLFGLDFGDGQGYDLPTGVSAVRIPVSGSASIQVTFNPSAALTQFNADTPTYSGMDYDPDNDRFLFYCGQGSGAGRIYVITPNDGNVWDMSLYAFGAGSNPPPATGGAGVNNRFQYLPNLKGFVLLSNAADNLYFLRTSTISASAPSITQQPAAQGVTTGQTATFTVAAGGTGPLSYQWQKNGSPIAGAVGASYTTPATTLADSGATFRVVVSNSAGTATSNSAALTVTDTPAPAPGTKDSQKCGCGTVGPHGWIVPLGLAGVLLALLGRRA